MKARWAATSALGLVLAVKLAVLGSLGEHPLLQPAGELDGAYYLHLAERIAAGDVWLERPESFFGRTPPPFFVAPLYAYWLAAGLALGASLQTIRLVQVLLGTAAVGLLALTARRWYGARAAWLAGGLAGFCGLFTFYEILILQAAIEPFLTALDLYLLTRAVQNERWTSWAAAGGAIGLHALNRPNLLFVLGGLAVAAAIARLVRSRRLVVHAVAFVAAGLIAISPATIRNWRASGELVAVSSHGGLNFLIGNGPESDGTYVPVLGLEPSIAGQWTAAETLVSRELGRDASASDVSRFMFARSWDWIREHPADEAALLARKAWYALSSSFLTLNHSFPFYVSDVRGPLAFLIVGPAIIVPLGLIGLFAARPRARNGYWLWACYVPLAIGSVVIFFVASRYRLPYQVALAVPAGGVVAWAFERWRETGWPRVAPAALGAAVLAVAVSWPTGLDDGRAEEQARMGLHSIESGQLTAGERWIELAVARHGFPGAVHVRAGQAYEAQGRLAEAVGHYRRAATIDPDEPSARFTLGRALHHLGRYEDAGAELARSLQGPQGGAAARLLILNDLRMKTAEAAERRMAEVDLAALTADQARDFASGLVDAGRPDLAINPWRQAALAGDQASDYERLGLALAVTGRSAEALAAFEEGVRREPRSPTLRLNLAVMLFEAGRRDAALREAEEALRLDPGYERARALVETIKGAG